MNLDLDEHEVDCKPMTNPCRTCRVVSFLRKRIGENGLAELDRLLNPTKSVTVQPPLTYSLEQVQLLDKDVSEVLSLSVRTGLCLKRAKIVTVRQVISKTESELLEIQNFGRKCLNELRERLAQKSLYIGMESSSCPE